MASSRRRRRSSTAANPSLISSSTADKSYKTYISLPTIHPPRSPQPTEQLPLRTTTVPSSIFDLSPPKATSESWTQNKVCPKNSTLQRVQPPSISPTDPLLYRSVTSERHAALYYSDNCYRQRCCLHSHHTLSSFPEILLDMRDILVEDGTEVAPSH